MSRIGKKPIPIPQGVAVEVAEDVVRIKGPLGQVEQKLPPRVSVSLGESELVVKRDNEEKSVRAFHGLARALLANAVSGVSKKFERVLEIQGIGYRAQVEGNKVLFHLGYSHPVNYAIPKGVEIEVEKQIRVVVRGVDKQRVGQAAAEIRRLRLRDVYKGKGIRYEGEQVKLKAGKAGA